jgi:hypothetical protein
MTMSSIAAKSFDSADEIRTPDNARIEVVDLGSAKAMRMTAQPGWRWSESVKPIVGTDSCRARHVGTVTSGSLRVRHDDGTEQDLTAGAAYVIEPGHDAWVTSAEPFVAFEFESQTADTYAKPS